VSGSESGGDLIAIPTDLLEPVGQLAALTKEYGSVPRAIFALISIYILNGIFSIFSVIVGAVLFVFDVFVGALDTARVLLVGGFAAVGVDLLGVLVSIQEQISAVVASAGPAGPPLAVGAASIMIYVGYRLGVALLGELPVGSTIVDLLGLR
jgi:uncharacterized membrane protein